MARTSNITFGQVASIADAMKAAGTRPTARAVRERIGSGSMGTIHKLLQQWQGKAGASDDEENEAAELPSHIQTALMDFIGTEIATACEPINEELQAAKEAAEQLAEENERLHKTIDELEKEHQNALHAEATEKGINAALRQEMATLKSAQSKYNENVGLLSREAERLKNELKMLANTKEKFDQAQKDLEEAKAGRIEAERNAAVFAAQLEAKTERVNELEQRAKTAENRANARDEEIKQANNHYQACAARLEAAAREIESLKKKPAAATKPKAPKTATKQTDGHH